MAPASPTLLSPVRLSPTAKKACAALMELWHAWLFIESSAEGDELVQSDSAAYARQKLNLSILLIRIREHAALLRTTHVQLQQWKTNIGISCSCCIGGVHTFFLVSDLIDQERLQTDITIFTNQIIAVNYFVSDIAICTSVTTMAARHFPMNTATSANKGKTTCKLLHPRQKQANLPKTADSPRKLWVSLVGLWL